jgi:hypothetical protein
MAQVVMVHGISHQLDAVDTIRAEWQPALAGGVRNAGFDTLADRLSPDSRSEDRFAVGVAFYGELFRQAGQMGDGTEELPLDLQACADELALAYLKRAAQAQDAELKRAAEEELAALGELEVGERMGRRSLERKLVARLARLPWLARLGMPAATWWLRELNQVTRYLCDEVVRDTAQRRLLQQVDDGTQVIVAHSLGSVVAYETCFRLLERRQEPLPLLVTVGSPLGLANIVYQRLRPQPPVFPPLVRRWVNVADRNDIVAAEPDLGRFFGSVPEAAVFDAAATVHNGREAHSITAYLTSKEVGRPIGETLTT